MDLRLAGWADAPDLATVSAGGGRGVSFGLTGAAHVAGRADGDAATYPAVLPDVDLRLRAQAGAVKETLVLRSPRSARAFVFPLHLSGLSARLAGGQVVLADRAGATVAVIPAGFLRDAGTTRRGPATSAAVRYELVTVDGAPALRVTADSAWLDDPDRAYPVELDPTVESTLDSDDADAGMVVQGSTTVAGSDTLLAGLSGGGPAASYVKFTGVADALHGDTVFDASLSVYNQDSASCTPRPLGVFPVTQAWTPTGSYTYPGPAVGSALTTATFAFRATPDATGAECGAAWENMDLFSGGAALVQGWVTDPTRNYGLSLRASDTDANGWKVFGGSGSAHQPVLWVTHSPYDAQYDVANTVADPPVLPNQAGTVRISVTNAGATAWDPATFALAYQVDGGAYQPAAALPAAVAPGAKVRLAAVIGQLPAGRHTLTFAMTRSNGGRFARTLSVALTVPDSAPVISELYPPSGYLAPTLTPQLRTLSSGGTTDPGAQKSYRFEICDSVAGQNPANCTSHPAPTRTLQVPAGRLAWNQVYLWRAFVTVNGTESAPTGYSALVTSVPQPVVGAALAGGQSVLAGGAVDPQSGDFTTEQTDAVVATVGPALSVVRTYNSLDARRDGMFGEGWSNRYDMRLVRDPDSSGNVVVAYGNGQQLRFGLDADGTYAPPPGRTESLVATAGGWDLLDSSGAVYTFSASGRLARISDAEHRAVVLDYANDGTLSDVRAQAQPGSYLRSLWFTWSGGHVSTVATDPVTASGATTAAPLVWHYRYDGDRLVEVCPPDAAGITCTRYSYGTGSHYLSVVSDAGPESYWRLAESPGESTAWSENAANLDTDTATYHNVILGSDPALAGTSDTSAKFNGASSWVQLRNDAARATSEASVELWFRSPAGGSGGPLLGYQDQRLDANPVSGAPMLYVGTDGRLVGQFGGVNFTQPIVTASPVSAAWHHVVLASTGTSQTLYLDGAKVGQANDRTIDGAASYVDQIGAAYTPTPAAWPGWATTNTWFFNGAIADVAVYQYALDLTTIREHYRAGTTAASELTSASAPGGRVTAQVSYDGWLDRVDAYTDPHGGTWRVGAPSVFGGATDLRRTVEVTDPAGRPYPYEYDALTGQLLRSAQPIDGGTHTVPASSCASPTPQDPSFCVTDGHDHPGTVAADTLAIRSYSYTGKGFLDQYVDEAGDQNQLTFDDRGNVTSSTTCRTATECHTAYWTYPTTVQDPYSPANNIPTAERDGRSSGPTDDTYLTTYRYDSDGQVLATSVAGRGTTQLTYTAAGDTDPQGRPIPGELVKTRTDAAGLVTTYSYTPAGDLAAVVLPNQERTEYQYDELGRKIKETTYSDTYPTGVVRTFGYDSQSRLTTTVDPATADPISGLGHQRQTTITYAADGNPVTTETRDLLTSDPARDTQTLYDDFGNPVDVVDAEGGDTSYDYDQFGNVISQRDSNGRTLDYSYDARNQLTEVRLRKGSGAPATGDADVVLDSYAYDQAGRQSSHTDAMGRTTRDTYYGDGLPNTVTLLGFHNPDGTTRDLVLAQDTYDGAGNLTRQDTAGGTRTTTNTYDPAGRLTTTIDDPAGQQRTTQYTYDGDDNVTTIVQSGLTRNPTTDGLVTRQTALTYDAGGNVIRQQVTGDGDQRVTTYAYDQRGALTAVTDPRGDKTGNPGQYTTTIWNDQLGRPVKINGPPVSVVDPSTGASASTRPTTVTGYNAFGEVTAALDERSNRWSYTYDKLGRRTSKKAPAYTAPGAAAPIVATTTYRYDSVGNLVSSVDPLGHTTAYNYDALGRMLSRDETGASSADLVRTAYAYSLSGRVLSVTDPNGAVSTATYDDLDRRITSTAVERLTDSGNTNFTTTYAYDDAGNNTATTTPGGLVTTTSYDNVNEPIETVSAGTDTTVGYDYLGRPITEKTAPAGGVPGPSRLSRLTYDQSDQIAARTDYNSAGTALRTRTNFYDATGNLVNVSDPYRPVTTYTYDAMNRLTGQSENVSGLTFTPGGATPDPGNPNDSGPRKWINTQFGYDAAGNRTVYIDGRGNLTSTTYNSLGLPEKVTEPATTADPEPSRRTWTATYDAAGNQVALLAPDGTNRTRTYDADGRLLTEAGTTATSPTPAKRQLRYDKAGQLVSLNTPTGLDTYAYNDRGDLVAADGPSGAATLTYDADDRVIARTDASGTAQFSYQDGRLHTLADNAGTSQTLAYDGIGELTGVDYGNNRNRTFTYDDLGRTTADVVRDTGQNLLSTSYTYDLNDRTLSKTTAGTGGDTTGTERYVHDHLGRITSWVDRAGHATNYTWDDAGNRTSAGTKTSTYDQRNRLLSDGDYTYTYTARGTVATRTSSGLTDTYAFDAFDRMIGAGAVSYTYDGLDRPASRSQSGTSQQFTYTGRSGTPVADGTEKYGRTPGGAPIDVTPTTGAGTWLPLADQHGDITAGLVPANHTSLDHVTDYDPFGVPTRHTGAANRLGFQGEWTDPTSGLVDMGARWENPATGTFLSRDSINDNAGVGGSSARANRYAYGGGDPIDMTDPSGHSWWSDAWDAVSSAASETVSDAYNFWSDTVDTVSNVASSIATSALDTVETAAILAAEYAVDPIGSTVRAGIWAWNHPAEAAGLVVNVVVNVGCDAAIGATGVGAVACAGLAGAAGSLTHDLIEGGHSPDELLRNALVEGAINGAVAGVFHGVGSLAGSAAAKTEATVGRDALESTAGRDALESTAGRDALESTTGRDAVESTAGRETNAARDAEAVAEPPAADPPAPNEVDPVAARQDANAAAMDDATCNSFAPDTPVLMADGSHKPISQIQDGDQVVATDPTTGQTADRTVTDTIVGQGDKNLVRITVDTDGNAGNATGTLVATDNHPFWVQDLHAWVNAGDLKPGELLRTAAGTYVQITAIQRYTAHNQRVYNLTVDTTHTYYVTAGDTPVLVHNCEVGSADKLRKALEAAGYPEPSTPHSPHHIVAGNSPRAAPARAQLDKFKIGVNDAANGVWLPRSGKSPNPNGLSVHSRVHTNEYYDYVNKMMEAANSWLEAVSIIDSIRGELLRGEWGV
ncbi:MAG TPA: polymorphic toxin-type HINT domain-containing protein [Rugosimonospora sp.]|nr:polymorphic toxin-type HINT domain-containing protein [Rugosimonospora sp.]